MSETSLPPETSLQPEAIAFAEEPYEPHLEKANRLAQRAIDQEVVYGSSPGVQAKYEAAMEQFNQAAFKGADVDADPIVLAANWAVVASWLEAGPVDEYISKTVTDGITVLEVPENRRRDLANKTREYLSKDLVYVARQSIRGNIPVETVVEVGIIAASHIETLGRKRLLDQLDPTSKQDQEKSPLETIKRVEAVISYAAMDVDPEDEELLGQYRNLVSIYENNPDYHNTLSRFALKAMLEDDPTILIEAAQHVEELASPYIFAQAA